MKTLGAPSRWPSHCDIFGYLRTQTKPVELSEIIRRVGYSKHCSMRAVRELHALGVIHIAAWKPADGGGFPAKLWKCWPGNDAQKPALVAKRTSRLKWYHGKIKRMTDLYGREVARKMVYSKACGGSDKIVIDGKTVFERQSKGGRPARSAA
jgi:hypothetical protein